MPVTRLLAIGDVHLGRLSSRLPADLPAGLDAASLGPAAALREAVKTALSLDVQAVLLAGDLADGDGDLYHALGVLTEVLGPLASAGVAVLAVAGNHDHEVLSRLARALPGLRILGAGGRWETVTVDGPGGPVRVLGWSFPCEHHPLSPAADLRRLPDGPPAVGLLHADLDAPSSRYAPVRRAELAQAGPCRWLLGHVHAPSLDPGGREPGYLGSLVGLDPTETGPRGPWLVEVEGGGATLRFLPQAPLRWDRLDIAVDAAASPRDDLPALIAAALRAYAAERAPELALTRVAGLRLRLVGRAADYGALKEAVAALASTPPVLEIASGLVGFVDQVLNDARPRHDLDALAERDDPPGLLARELLALQAGAAGELLQQARQAIVQVDGGTNLREFLMPGPPPDATLADLLLRGGYEILDGLLHTKRGADGAA